MLFLFLLKLVLVQMFLGLQARFHFKAQDRVCLFCGVQLQLQVGHTLGRLHLLLELLHAGFENLQVWLRVSTRVLSIKMISVHPHNITAFTRNSHTVHSSIHHPFHDQP